MRNSQIIEELVRSNWSEWLTLVMERENLSVSGLAMRLANPSATIQQVESAGKRVIRDATPRAQVRRWLDGRSTVSPKSAFKCGEALRRMGARDTGGPIALYAAGWDSWVIEFLDRLCDFEAGRWPALALFVGLPEWKDKLWLRSVATWETDLRGRDELEDYIADARRLCMSAIDDAGDFLEDTFDRCNGGRGRGAVVKRAISNSIPEEGISRDLASSLAWNTMQSWAIRLFQLCSGTRDVELPAFTWHTLEDFMVHGRYPMFNLKQILELRPPSVAQKGGSK